MLGNVLFTIFRPSECFSVSLKHSLDSLDFFGHELVSVALMITISQTEVTFEYSCNFIMLILNTDTVGCCPAISKMQERKFLSCAEQAILCALVKTWEKNSLAWCPLDQYIQLHSSNGQYSWHTSHTCNSLNNFNKLQSIGSSIVGYGENLKNYCRL